MQDLIQKARLTPAILKDPSKRAAAIDEYNAKIGGLRGLARAGKLEPASTHPIPEGVSKDDLLRYLRFVAAGKRVPIIFAAGRATRMKLPRAFDKLGIGGLTENILSALNALREGDEAPSSKVSSSAAIKKLINAAANAEGHGAADLSLVQRQILQLRYQLEILFSSCASDNANLDLWLENGSFAVVANEENKTSIALQLAAVKFAGLKAKHVYVIVQPEEGGLEVLADGSTKPYSKETWPEGHGKPFLDMQADTSAAFRLNSLGHLVPLKKTLASEFSARGIERAVFAQVNDLHLLEDMVHLERWLAADRLIASGLPAGQAGAEMVLEMVDNGLQQKGGGIFTGPEGTVIMRDTIAMKTGDLEPYSIPQSLSRMFYELTVSGIQKLSPGSLPEYLTERKAGSGKPVLTREYYSGDASGALKAQAVRQPGYALDTFKMQSRIPYTLSILQKQLSQPGFQVFLSNL